MYQTTTLHTSIHTILHVSYSSVKLGESPFCFAKTSICSPVLLCCLLVECEILPPFTVYANVYIFGGFIHFLILLF